MLNIVKSDNTLIKDFPQTQLDTGIGLGLAIPTGSEASDLQTDRLSKLKPSQSITSLFEKVFQSKTKEELAEAEGLIHTSLEQMHAKKEIDPTNYQKFKEKLEFTKSATATYLDSVERLDHLSNDLTALTAGCCCGIDSSVVEILGSELSTLEGLVLKIGNVEELSELVQAEVNEVGFQLEALERALKRANNQLVPNAIAAYQALLKQPMPADFPTRKVHSQNLSIAKKRLEVIHAWSEEMAKQLPGLQKSWNPLTNRYQCDTTDLTQLGIQVADIGSTVAPLVEIGTNSSSSTIELSNEELFASTPERQRGYFETFLGYITKPIHALCHPEEWSETTKSRVLCGLSLMQLSAQGIGFLEQREQFKSQAEKMQQQLISALPQNMLDKVDRDSGFLGTLLSDKWDQLEGSKLVDRIPQGREFVAKAKAQFQTKPSSDQIQALMDQYKTTQLASHLPPSSPYQDQVNALVEGGSMIQSWFSRAESTLSSLQTSALALKQAQQTLLQTEETATPITQEILELRKETQLLATTLQRNLDVCPVEIGPFPLFASWEQELSETCFAIEELEKRIDALMDKARGRIDDQMEGLSIYGNKHKNIVRLKQLFEALGAKDVTVPTPKGVSHDEVVTILKTHAPEVFTYWNTLGTLYSQFEGEDFLQDSTFKELQSKIHQGIAFAFDQVDETQLPPHILRWLDKVKSTGHHLMVRSTGAEDSRSLTNAGGNASPTYVAPNPKAFLKAVGVVVSSYFGVDSLKNRLNGKTNPFTEPLKIPVTSQELIGESVGGASSPSDIPISLVLFSNEPLYVGKEKFRVMRMSATFGHGEAVVDNVGVATDTALVLQSVSQPDELYVLYDQNAKPARLAPVQAESGKIELQKVKNSPYMANKRVLSEEMIQRLYQVGILSEKYFKDDGGTDMEIVIKGEKVYPVQARPVNRKPMLPTYIDLTKLQKMKASPIEKTIQGKVVVPGKASVIEVTNPSEILIAPTLKQAQDLYKEGHKLIVIQQDEPLNSHPVVNFSGLGVPCLYISDKTSAKSLLEQISSEKSVAVCIQSGAVHLWNNDQPVREFIEEGFIRHPAEIGVSVLSSQKMIRKGGIQSKPLKNLQTLFSKIHITPTLELLGQIKSDPWLEAFYEETDGLQQKTDSSMIPVAKAAITLQHEIEKSLEELESLITSQVKDNRLQVLFHLKALETLLFAEPEANSLRHSALSIQEGFQAVKEIESYQAKLDHPAQFSDILLAGSMSPNKEKYIQWKAFLLDLESKEISAEKKAHFKKLITQVEKAGTLPTFITLFFNFDQETNSLNLLDELLKLSTNPEHIAPLLEMQAVMAVQKQNLQGFAKPDTFDKSYKNLKKQLDPFIKEEDLNPLFFKEGWEEASPITKIIAIETMDRVVETYDLAIKEMMGSTEYTRLEKGTHLNEMLTPLLKLLDTWATNLQYPDHIVYKKEYYIQVIDGRISKLKDLDAREHSPYYSSDNDFNVQGALLGTYLTTGSRFEEHLPNSLENVWTLLHQNLIQIQSQLVKGLIQSSSLQEILPEELYKHTAKTDQISEFSRRLNPDISSIKINEQTIEIKYNVALRDHSSMLEFNYDRNTDQTTLTIRVAGIREGGRWDAGKRIFDVFNHPEGIPLVKPVDKGAMGIQMQLKLPPSEAASKSKVDIWEMFSKFALYTCGVGYNQSDFWSWSFENVPASCMSSLLEAYLESRPYEELSDLAVERIKESAPQKIEEMIRLALQETAREPSEFLLSKRSLLKSVQLKDLWKEITSHPKFTQLNQSNISTFWSVCLETLPIDQLNEALLTFIKLRTRVPLSQKALDRLNSLNPDPETIASMSEDFARFGLEILQENPDYKIHKWMKEFPLLSILNLNKVWEILSPHLVQSLFNLTPNESAPIWTFWLEKLKGAPLHSVLKLFLRGPENISISDRALKRVQELGNAEFDRVFNRFIREFPQKHWKEFLLLSDDRREMFNRMDLDQVWNTALSGLKEESDLIQFLDMYLEREFELIENPSESRVEISLSKENLERFKGVDLDVIFPLLSKFKERFGVQSRFRADFGKATAKYKKIEPFLELLLQQRPNSTKTLDLAFMFIDRYEGRGDYSDMTSYWGRKNDDLWEMMFRHTSSENYNQVLSKYYDVVFNHIKRCHDSDPPVPPPSLEERIHEADCSKIGKMACIASIFVRAKSLFNNAKAYFTS